MDYLQDSGSSQPNDDQDLQRYHKLFKNYKQIKESIQRQNVEKESSKKSYNSVQKAIQVQEQKNLETRISFTEKQYAKARQNNILLLKKLSEAEEQNEFLKFEIDKIRREKEEEIDELRRELGRVKGEIALTKEQRQYEEKEQQYGEMAELKSKLEHKDKEISRLFLKIKSLELDRKNNENEIKSLNGVNEMLKQKIGELQSTMNEVYMGQESKGAQLLQLQQAKEAIDRLAVLLRSTEQYKKMTHLADDLKQAHYLKNIMKRLKSNGLNQQIQRKRACSCCQVKMDEKLLWTPTACYKIMLEMKLKYEQMSEDCIEETLFELNKLWLIREEAHIGRVRESYDAEIARLRKKSQERYDEMVARKQIQRLKKELQESKFSKKSGASDNLDLLKNIGQYEDELRLKQREIKLLQDRIRLMQTENNNYDKVLYLEGALWIIDKILGEIDTNNQEYHQFQNRFRESSQTLTTNEAWINSFKEFFETISEINGSLVEKLMLMKDSTLKKMGSQRGHIRESVVEHSRRT